MAQGTQRDPLSIASGGLPGLFGTTFSPIPATEGDIAARSRAIVPQFGGAPAQILSTPTFRPTAQAVLPTPLLRRPEEVGRAAFRQIREEAQFPVLKPAETIEEIDNRLRSILPVIEQVPPQQPVPGGSGSILEPPTPPTPPPPPVMELGAVTPVTPPPLQTMPEAAMPVAPVTALPQPDNSLMQILQALTEPGTGFDRDYGPSFDRGGYEGPATATGSFGSTGGYTSPSFEVGERFDRFGDWGFDRYV
jgi:hypothetical protein